MNNLFTKLVVASGTSLVVVENAQLAPLWSALITLAISIITVLSAEGISLLKAWFKKKKAQQEAEQHKYEEEDNAVQSAEIEEKINNKEE